MSRLFLAIIVTVLSTQAFASDLHVTAKLDRKQRSEIKCFIGEQVFILRRKSPLPNAFGNPDIFGRKIDRGFLELRFLGLTRDGYVKFKIKDVQKNSNETTLSRSPITVYTGSGTETYTPGTNTAHTHITILAFGTKRNEPEDVQKSVTEFEVDPKTTKALEFEKVKVLILDVNATNLSYKLERKY